MRTQHRGVVIREFGASSAVSCNRGVRDVGGNMVAYGGVMCHSGGAPVPSERRYSPGGCRGQRCERRKGERVTSVSRRGKESRDPGGHDVAVGGRGADAEKKEPANANCVKNGGAVVWARTKSMGPNQRGQEE